MSFANGTYFTAMPYLILRMGGRDQDVGLCGGLEFVAYVIACIFAAGKLDRMNPRTLGASGCGVFVVCHFLMWCIFMLWQAGIWTWRPVESYIVLGMVIGFGTMMLWPPIMGWVSSNCEGVNLNRRLAVYNVSWTSGMTLGPFVAGKICETDPGYALLVVVVICTLAGIMVLLAQNPGVIVHKEVPEGQPGFVKDPRLLRFRLMSRAALIVMFFCATLARTQMPLLYKIELGFTESQYGITMGLMNLATAVMFFIFMKVHQWHYKYAFHFVVQVFTLAAMTLIAMQSYLPVMYGMVIILGIGQSYSYMAHQYYSVSGSKQRSRQMAIHEILLAIGMAMGPIVGGYSAEWFSRRYAPYLCGAGLIALALLFQLIICVMPDKDTDKNISQGN